MTTINTTNSSTLSVQSQPAATEVLFALLPGNEERTTAAPANNIVPFVRPVQVAPSSVPPAPSGTPSNYVPYVAKTPTGVALSQTAIWAPPGSAPPANAFSDDVRDVILNQVLPRIFLREVQAGDNNPRVGGFSLSDLRQLQDLQRRAELGQLSYTEYDFMRRLEDSAIGPFLEPQPSPIAFDSGQTYGPSAPPSQPSVAPAPAQPAVTPLDDNPWANDLVPLTSTELTQLGLLDIPAPNTELDIWGNTGEIGNQGIHNPIDDIPYNPDWSTEFNPNAPARTPAQTPAEPGSPLERQRQLQERASEIMEEILRKRGNQFAGGGSVVEDVEQRVRELRRNGESELALMLEQRLSFAQFLVDRNHSHSYGVANQAWVDWENRIIETIRDSDPTAVAQSVLNLTEQQAQELNPRFRKELLEKLGPLAGENPWANAGIEYIKNPRVFTDALQNGNPIPAANIDAMNRLMANPVTQNVAGPGSLAPTLRALNQQGIAEIVYIAFDGDRMKRLNTAIGYTRADDALENMTGIAAATFHEVKSRHPGTNGFVGRHGGDEFEGGFYGPGAELAMKDFVATLQSNLARASASGNIVPQVSGAYTTLPTHFGYDSHALEVFVGGMDAAGIDATKSPDGAFNRNTIVGLNPRFDQFSNQWRFDETARFLGPTYDAPPAEGDAYTTANNKVARAPDGDVQPNVTQIDEYGNITSRPELLPSIDIGQTPTSGFVLPPEVLTRILQEFYGLDAGSPGALADLQRLAQIDPAFREFANEMTIYNLPNMLDKIDEALSGDGELPVIQTAPAGMKAANERSVYIDGNGNVQSGGHAAGDALLHA